ncbi:MAG: T9SS C-terminal target domain-containing protein [Ignavibacteriae bacterium]|nr:MAG: T9SS C-terminal target domain-containing protein [Ignavibacteriota bacterium]
MKYMFRILILLVLAAPMAQAGSWWERVSDISVSENGRLEGRGGRLFLFDEKKAYVSSDKGGSWSSLESVFPRGVYEIRDVGQFMFAFVPGEKNGSVLVYRSADQGGSWKFMSAFALTTGSKLRDVATLGSGLYAISDGQTIQVSWDGGVSWNERSVDPYVGNLIDFAASESIWVACGTEGAMWSADAGLSWYPSQAPHEVGSGIFHVEAFKGTIWAGGRLGSCTFDMNSRSWNVENAGLPVFASLVGQPTALTARGGVLFGVFKTYDGASTVMRRSAADSKWLPMESAGLPPHNLASRRNFAVVGQNLFVYYHGDDIGFIGLYRGVNDAPTSVEETSATSNVTVGPLPAIDHVNVSTTAGESVELTVVDMSGLTVYTGSMREQTTIDVRTFASGAYTLIVTDASGVVTTPMVVAR